MDEYVVLAHADIAVFVVGHVWCVACLAGGVSVVNSFGSWGDPSGLEGALVVILGVAEPLQF